MTETMQTPPYTLGADEKSAPVMAYTANALFWGDVVVKEVIRISTWLRTVSAPDRVCLYNARMITTLTGSNPRPIMFPELHIATTQILAFHLVPPNQEPLDIDPTEPNRRMVPTSLLFSTFRAEGNLRMATRSSLGKFLEVNRETFLTIYDAKISNLVLPAFGDLNVPNLLVRQETTVFATA